MSTPTTTAAILETQMEVRISASVAVVWKALTEDIGAWWPEAFFAGGEQEKRHYHLEPEPGGRMYESWEGGGGILWGNVVAVDPGKLLQVTGTTFPNWGGPSIWFGTWELEADETVTLLKFSESTIGRIDDAHAAGKEKAWKFLFATVLKSFVEGTPIPEWQD